MIGLPRITVWILSGNFTSLAMSSLTMMDGVLGIGPALPVRRAAPRWRSAARPLRDVPKIPCHDEIPGAAERRQVQVERRMVNLFSKCSSRLPKRAWRSGRLARLARPLSMREPASPVALF